MTMVRQEDSLVMLTAAKHFEAHRERPFAAAQGDMGRQLWVMCIGRNSLRPYDFVHSWSVESVGYVESVGCVTGRK